MRQGNELKPALLYQSDILNLDYNTVKIERVDSEVFLINLLYINHPYLNQSIINNLDGLINIRCDQFGKKNGLSYKDDAHTGLSMPIENVGDHVWYNYYGTKVHVYGHRGGNSPIISIKIDGEIVAILDLQSSRPGAGIVYTSEDLQFGFHAIVINVEKTKSPYKDPFHISSIFFDPLPKVGGYKLGFNDKADFHGNWVQNTEKNSLFYFWRNRCKHNI